MKSMLFTVGFIITAQSLLFGQTDSTVIKSVPNIKELKAGDKKVVFPESPKGYSLVFKGSNRTPIIDESGSITTPLVATNVNLYFQLVSQVSDSIKYDVSRQVVVPGKFSDSGVNPQPFVIPALREWHGGKGELFLTATSRIVLNAANEKQLQNAANILDRKSVV